MAIMLSGWLADRVGRRNTLGTMACLIGIFSFLAPWLLGSGTGQQCVHHCGLHPSGICPTGRPRAP
jgi:MFS family permease